MVLAFFRSGSNLRIKPAHLFCVATILASPFHKVYGNELPACIQSELDNEGTYIVYSDSDYVTYRIRDRGPIQVLRELYHGTHEEKEYKLYCSHDNRAIQLAQLGDIQSDEDRLPKEWPRLYLCCSDTLVTLTPIEISTPNLFIIGASLDDYLGDPSAELKVRAHSYLWREKTSEALHEMRDYYYAFPSMKFIASIPVRTYIHSKDYDKFVEHKISYLDNPGAGKQIEFVDELQGITVTVDMNSDAKVVSAYREVSEPLGEKRTTEEFLLRIVDESGFPVPNAGVKGSTRQFSSPGGPVTDSRQINITTDDYGFATIPVLDQVSFFITAEGYFPARVSWDGQIEHSTPELQRFKLPDNGSQEVILKKKPESVRLIHGNFRQDYEHAANNFYKIELGLEIELDRFGNPISRTTTRKIDSDFWIVILLRDLSDKEGEIVYSSSLQVVDRIQIDGVNEWELQVVSPENISYTAPMDGYKNKVELLPQELPAAIYISKNNRRRFGLLSDINYSWRYGSTYKFRLQWLLQEKDYGIPSLWEDVDDEVEAFLKALEDGTSSND